MTFSPGDRYILDASIALKWYLSDEEYIDHADWISTEFSEGRIILLAPQHILYEVTNSLLTAVRRQRLSTEDARTAANEFLSLDLSLVVGTQLIVRGWDSATFYGCAFYDGMYVALAEMTGARLVHADRRLHNTLNGRFPLELWVEDLLT